MTKETTPLESKIRAHLAQNLTVLESGLTLIKEEFPLKNPHGAGGYIDILARDLYGHLVVIELKRSNSTARQAVHELFKYVALLRNEHNLGPESVRCILASTDWHELQVPFAEFVRAVPYPTKGFLLHVEARSPDMRVGATLIQPLPEGAIVRFCPAHQIFLYRTDERRDSTLPSLERAVSEEGIEGACILSMKYAGSNTRVIYPFANYLAIQEFSPTKRLQRASEIDPEELEANEWMVEETAIGRIPFRSADTIESGSPERLSHQMVGWEVESVHRIGSRLQNPLLLPDELLVSQIRGREGRNALSLSVVASPQFSPSWTRLVEESRYTLMGNEFWSQVVTNVLDDVAINHSGATVSVKLFNPSDTLTNLTLFAVRGEEGALPAFEIIVDEEDGVNVTLVYGVLGWDGRKRPKPLHSTLTKLFHEPSGFFLCKTVGEMWRYDDILVAQLGLRYSAYKMSIVNGDAASCTRFLLEGETLREEPAPCGPDPSLMDYLRKNPTLILEATEFFSKYSNFLDQQ